jgi:hypothetical protein
MMANFLFKALGIVYTLVTLNLIKTKEQATG